MPGPIDQIIQQINAVIPADARLRDIDLGVIAARPYDGAYRLRSADELQDVRVELLDPNTIYVERTGPHSVRCTLKDRHDRMVGYKVQYADVLPEPLPADLFQHPAFSQPIFLKAEENDAIRFAPSQAVLDCFNYLNQSLAPGNLDLIGRMFNRFGLVFDDALVVEMAAWKDAMTEIFAQGSRENCFIREFDEVRQTETAVLDVRSKTYKLLADLLERIYRYAVSDCLGADGQLRLDLCQALRLRDAVNQIPPGEDGENHRNFLKAFKNQLIGGWLNTVVAPVVVAVYQEQIGAMGVDAPLNLFELNRAINKDITELGLIDGVNPRLDRIKESVSFNWLREQQAAIKAARTPREKACEAVLADLATLMNKLSVNRLVADDDWTEIVSEHPHLHSLRIAYDAMTVYRQGTMSREATIDVVRDAYRQVSAQWEPGFFKRKPPAIALLEKILTKGFGVAKAALNVDPGAAAPRDLELPRGGPAALPPFGTR